MSSWGLYQKVSKGLKKGPNGLFDHEPEANDQIQGGPPPRPTDCGIDGCPRPGADGHGVRKMVGMNGHGIRQKPTVENLLNKHIQLKK